MRGLPLNMLVHPKLSGDCIKLIAYIVDEYQHKPYGIFQKKMFMEMTGTKRVSVDKAIGSLIEKKILAMYPDEGEAVVELDMTTLFEFVNTPPLNIFERMTGWRVKNKKEESAL